MREELKKIYTHFGLATQLQKQREEHIEAAEASADLSTSLTFDDHPEHWEHYRKNLIGEMADAHIMDTQIIHALGAEEEFKAMVEAKIQRTLKRIDEGYYDE